MTQPGDSSDMKERSALALQLAIASETSVSKSDNLGDLTNGDLVRELRIAAGALPEGSVDGMCLV